MEPVGDRSLERRAAPPGAAFVWPVLIVAAMWIVALVDAALPVDLGPWGIVPRTRRGLVGILLSPFLHSGLHHLVINTVPVLVLGGLVSLRGARTFLTVTLSVVIFGGAGVWLLARPASHIGASGLIFGYFGFLIADAWYRRSLWTFLVAAVLVFVYGGVVFSGLFPASPGISWEGHLAGLIAGVVTARALRPAPGSRGALQRGPSERNASQSGGP